MLSGLLPTQTPLATVAASLIGRSILNPQFSTGYLVLCSPHTDPDRYTSSQRPFTCVAEQIVIKAVFRLAMRESHLNCFHSLGEINILVSKILIPPNLFFW